MSPDKEPRDSDILLPAVALEFRCTVGGACIGSRAAFIVGGACIGSIGAFTVESGTIVSVNASSHVE